MEEQYVAALQPKESFSDIPDLYGTFLTKELAQEYLDKELLKLDGWIGYVVLINPAIERI